MEKGIGTGGTYRAVLVDYRNGAKNRLVRVMFKIKRAANGILIEKETKFAENITLYRLKIHSVKKVRRVMNFPEVFSLEEDAGMFPVRE